MKKFHSILTLIPFLLTVIACTSMYEVGDDRTAEFSIAPVAGVNSAFDEVAPKATTHGLLFTSNRPVDEEEERDVLYILPHGGGGQGAVRAVTMDNPSIKTGAVTLFPDGHSVLFVQCYRPDGVGDCDMLSARLTTDGAGLERIELLPEPLNDIEWDHHPALTPDGNTLIFASERFGGRGGSDLWMSTERNGEWSIPVNLGAVINTTGNEIAPCFSSDGKTLYFASDTHPGMGGFDLYVSHRVDGGWSAPNPLGMPFNSDEDDIFFAGDLAADTVYLASNRDGGEGGFDLYRAVRRVITKAPEPVREKPLVLRITAKNAYTMQTIAAEISVTHTQTEDVIT
ncbi:MAG: PD40 domain-containing protein, partial [Bacteroidetes bacterium]|nr:PD40 domain-containing protein [Bacteroidota bacterium]